MPKITVIMPSLNVASYMRQCLRSVLEQTLEDIEVVAVDAGSTDGTLEILQEYVAADRRISVIQSDKRSYGYQVNVGLEAAQGEYISIVETDDRIADDMYEMLYAVARDQNLDYVKGRGMFFIDLKNGSQWQTPIWLPLSDDEIGKVIVPCDKPGILEYDVFLWNGLYKREFLKNIRFNESEGAAFQDQGFLFQVISSAGKAVYLDKVVYYYRQDNSGSSVVNSNGFHFLVNEYAYMKQFLPKKEIIWTKMYYIRMLKQCFGRYRSMTIKGEFWEDALDDIRILKQWILEAYDNGFLQEDVISLKDRELLEIFMKDERKLFTYLLAETYSKAELFFRLVDKIKDRSIVVFGCSATGRFVHALFENKMQGKVVAFCDNNSALCGSSIQGVKVMEPAEAVKAYPNAAFIITGTRSAEDMKRQLKQISKADICFFEYTPEIEMRLFLMEL